MKGQGIPELALQSSIFHASGTDIHEHFHECFGVQEVDNML